MSRRSLGQSNATKSNVKSCNLGHGKQIRPCCDRNNPMGSSCHYSNNVLNLNGELSSLKKLKMEKEHEAYHTMEDKITTTSSEGHQIGSYPSKSVIRKRLVIKSLPAIKRERGFLEDSINMREAWMIKWFKAASKSIANRTRAKTRSNSRPRTKSNSRPRSRSKTNITRKILHLKTTVKRRSIDSQTRKQRINKVLFNMKEKIKNNRT